MKQKFLPNLLFLLFVNVLVKPFWLLGVDREVQNTVGAEEYGTYFALLNFAFLFQMLLDFGIDNYNNRHLAQHEDLLKNYLPNILLLKLGLALSYVALLAGAALVIGYSSEQLYLLSWLGLNLVLISFIKYFRSNISALHYFKIDSLLSALDKVLMIAVIGYLLWFSGSEITIKQFVIGQSAAYGITSLVGLIASMILSKGLQFNFSSDTIKEVVKGSWPYALGFFLMSVFNKVDAVMIERMLPNGAEEAGVYASAYRLLDALNMVGFLFAGLLLPLFARMLKQGEAVGPLVDLAFKTIFAIGLIICITSTFFRVPIMEVLYVSTNEHSATVFGILILSFLSVGSWYVFGTLLSANNNLRQLNMLFAICMVLNVVLNYLLIPKYQSVGAAIATLLTQTIVLVAEIVMSKRYLKVNISLSTAGSLLALLIFVLLGNLFLSDVFSLWYWNFLFVLTISSIFALIVRSFDARELLASLKQGRSE